MDTMLYIALTGLALVVASVALCVGANKSYANRTNTD